MSEVNINYEVNRAVDRVATSARLWPLSDTPDVAINFLRAVLPPDHPARRDIDRAAAAFTHLRKRLAPTDGADRDPDDHTDVATACAAAIDNLRTRPVRLLVIGSAAELAELRRNLGARPDWHEPDEQNITVTVTGGSFDNATAISDLEAAVVIHQNGHPVAVVNLATLFAFATNRL